MLKMNTDILLMQAEIPDQEADGLGLEAAISPTARENIAALWMLSVGVSQMKSAQKKARRMH